MNAPARIDPTRKWPEGELATATDFVRHFGHYAASSLSKPVYIAQHGRVGWALLSAAQMTRLSETEIETVSDDARFDILLDTIPTMVMLVDSKLQITRVNCAARRHFQFPEVGSVSISLWKLLQEDERVLIRDVCQRVLNSGDSETFDIESTRYPGRILRFQITPFPSGLAILADVVTEAVRIRQTLSAAAATDEAADVISSLGRGSIDARGTISGVNENFASLIQETSEKLVGLRLIDLVEPDSQDRVAQAIEQLMQTGKPMTLDVQMVTRSAKEVSVTIGAGAERSGGAIVGAALIVMLRD